MTGEPGGVGKALVEGAKSLEAEARPEAIHAVAAWFRQGRIADLDRVGTVQLPLLFDGIFGTRPLSFRFIRRSILASCVTWLVLMLLKGDGFTEIWTELTQASDWIYYTLFPVWFVVDWLSLIKARLILTLLARGVLLESAFLFLVLDIVLSLALTLAALFLYSQVLTLAWQGSAAASPAKLMWAIWQQWFANFQFIRTYLDAPAGQATFNNVLIPSTLLTSAWALLFLVSSLVVRLLAPLDYVRRFAVWWFRDFDERPLSSVAKVAATLLAIAVGGVKLVRWLSAA